MHTPKRIVFCGFQHETNTFAPTQADLLAFERGGGWPGLVSGDAVFEAIAGRNIPAAGFVDAARRAGHTVLPTVWCAASPSAHVTEAAYEHIAGESLAGVGAVLPVDAVYLGLHGAMVATHFDDGEGELLRRIRALVGDAVPVVGSLDLHANVTAQMLDRADALVAYRTYPHVDMASTGKRSLKSAGQAVRVPRSRSARCRSWCRSARSAPTCSRPRVSMRCSRRLKRRIAPTCRSQPASPRPLFPNALP